LGTKTPSYCLLFSTNEKLSVFPKNIRNMVTGKHVFIKNKLHSVRESSKTTRHIFSYLVNVINYIKNKDNNFTLDNY
jgi:hypothetical protein